MTEPNIETAPAETDTSTPTMPEREIDFMGRKVWVRMPSPEALLVWQRLVARLQGFDVSKVTSGSEVLSILTRIRSVLDSLLVHQSDIDWIDDEMLAGRLKLNDLIPMIPATVTAFKADNNRAEKRAAKKASRKKGKTG